jgi:hypothetical protein
VLENERGKPGHVLRLDGISLRPASGGKGHKEGKTRLSSLGGVGLDDDGNPFSIRQLHGFVHYEP